MTRLLVFVRFHLRLWLWQHQCDQLMDLGYMDGRDELYVFKLPRWSEKVMICIYMALSGALTPRARWLL